MASVTRLLLCRVGATSLALQQPRYFCYSLVGSRSSRLVKPVGHRFSLPKPTLLAVPPLKTWGQFWKAEVGHSLASTKVLVHRSVKQACVIVHVLAEAARAAHQPARGMAPLLPHRGHRHHRRRSQRVPPPAQRAERRRLAADAVRLRACGSTPHVARRATGGPRRWERAYMRLW